MMINEVSDMEKIYLKKYIYHNAVAQQLQQYDEIGKEDCRLYSGERKERDEPDDFRFGS